MGRSIGEIALDLTINPGRLMKQANTESNNAAKVIEGNFNRSFKKIGAMAAAALSVRAIGNFVSDCLKLGSDLAEVQNVVDTAFPHMTKRVNEFAKNAMEQFGLSETVAKNYMGTFGAMSKAFGYNEQAAESMSETLTGLAGDVASFYNMSTDEAFTKLKSVFTGETESLKSLGVVMTETALNAFAMANGFGKTVNKMTEQEKVALRLAFVTDKLSMASGDFAKTSDSWANQTRVLTLRFDALKASLGKGFIALFTPIVKGINWVLAALKPLADSFASMMEFLTGKKTETSGGGIADNFDSTASAANNASNAVQNAGDSASGASDKAGKASDNAAKKAKKNAKAIQKAFAKIDTINKLTFGNNSDSSSDPQSSGGSGGKGSDSGSGAGGNMPVGKAVDFGKPAQGATIFSNIMKGIIDEITRLKDLFKSGFDLGFGNSLEIIDSIKSNLESIGISLKDIFTDPGVVSAAKRMAESIVFNLGLVAGSATRIGLSFIDLFTGSVSKYLDSNKEFLKRKLIEIFDITSKRSAIIGTFSLVVADIAEAFRSSTAKNIGSNLIGIIANGAISSMTLIYKLGTDILNAITQPIITNKNAIIEAIQSTLKPIDSVIEIIKTTLDGLWMKVDDVYNNHIKPAIDAVSGAWSALLKGFLNGYNTFIVPVLNWFANGFKHTMEGPVGNAINSVKDTFSTLWDAVRDFYTAIQPVANFLGGAFAGVLGLVGGILGGAFLIALNVVSVAVKFLADTIKAIIDVFRAFGSVVSSIASSAKNAIVTFKEGAVNAFNGAKSIMNSLISWLKSTFGPVFGTVFSAAKTAVNGFKNYLSPIFNSIKGVFNGITSFLSGVFTNNWRRAWNGVKSIFSNIVGGFANIFKAPLNAMIGGVNAMIGGLNKVKIPDWVPVVGGKGINIPKIPKLAQGGYVGPNQPRLAMIGDNRHYGEIVAPENKLEDMVDNALKRQKESGNLQGLDILISLIRELIELVKTLKIKVDLDMKRLSISLENAQRERKMIGG